jgi:hypothetical protein
LLGVFALIEVDNRDLGPFPREQNRNSAPDPAVAAGDHRHLVREPAAAREPGLVVRLGIHLGFVTGLGGLLLRRERLLLA